MNLEDCLLNILFITIFFWVCQMQMTTRRSSVISQWRKIRAKRYLILMISFLMIILPRVILLGKVCTVDEPNWMFRSQRFIMGIGAGDIHELPIPEHPGVTIMWIAGMTGRVVKKVHAFHSGDSCHSLWSYGTNMKRRLLKAEQMAIAFVISVIAWMSCLWISNALNSGTLLIMSSLLIGADPFYVGLSRIVNPDGLMATFAFASCAALIRFFLDGGLRHSWVFISGLFAGLSTITKSSGLILIAWFMVVVMITVWMQHTEAITGYWLRFRRWAHLNSKVGGIWFIGLLVIFIGLWPTLWVDTFHALARFTEGIWSGIASPHQGSVAGLLGRGPGAWDYVIRLAIFIAPWIPWILAIGMVFAVLFAFIDVRHKRGSFMEYTFGIADIDHHKWIFAGIALITFSLSFVVVMSFTSKQAGRYILASFIGIDMFAALLSTVVITKAFRIRPGFKPCGLLFILGLMVWCGTTIATWLPYTTTYRHPSFGNLPVSGKPLPYWWGEGMEKAAEVLNKMKGNKKLVVSTSHPSVLFMFLKGDTDTYRGVFTHKANYAVLYRDFVERYPNSQLVGKYLSKCPLVETIYLPHYTSKPIAWIYDTQYLN